MQVSPILVQTKSAQVVPNNRQESTLPSFKSEPDKVMFSANEPNKKSSNKKKLAYVLGGLAALGVIIFAIKRGKASGVKPKGDTPSEVPQTGNLSKPQPPPLPPETGKPVGIKRTQDESVKVASPNAISSVPKRWMLSEKEKANLKLNPTKDFKLNVYCENSYIQGNDLNKVMDAILARSGGSAKDKTVAREVLPTLIKYDNELRIGGHYERFLSSITPENKDFAMEHAVPWLAKYYKNSGLTDSYNNSVFMEGITADTIKTATKLVKESKELGLNHTNQFFDVMFTAIDKGEDFVLGKAIPNIIKSKNALLNPRNEKVADLVTMLTPQNINRVFKTDVPAIFNNAKRLKLDKDSGGRVVELLQSMDKNGKDFVLNIALPFVEKNQKTLKIADDYHFAQFVSKVTPENIDKLLLEA